MTNKSWIRSVIVGSIGIIVALLLRLDLAAIVFMAALIPIYNLLHFTLFCFFRIWFSIAVSCLMPLLLIVVVGIIAYLFDPDKGSGSGFNLKLLGEAILGVMYGNFILRVFLTPSINRRWPNRFAEFAGPIKRGLRLGKSFREQIGPYPKRPRADVMMESEGEQPLKVLRILQEIYALNTMMLNNVASKSTPFVITENIPQTEAEFVKSQLETAGAVISIVRR